MPRLPTHESFETHIDTFFMPFATTSVRFNAAEMLYVHQDTDLDRL